MYKHFQNCEYSTENINDFSSNDFLVLILLGSFTNTWICIFNRMFYHFLYLLKLSKYAVKNFNNALKTRKLEHSFYQFMNLICQYKNILSQ